MNSLAIVSGTNPFIWQQGVRSLELTPLQFEENLKNSNYTFPACQVVVLGSLHLDNFDTSASFPPDLCVEGDMVLKDCPASISLPRRLWVKGSLGLINYRPNFLPPDLCVEESLYLEDCPELPFLPSGLRVKKALYIKNCLALASLPPGLDVESLYVKNSPLASLPSGLRMKNLYLRYCSALTSLPHDLDVEEDLNLEGCTALTFLPQKLRVGGHLILPFCISLASLPDWITTLGLTLRGEVRRVDLTSTGLSDSIVNSLRNTPAPGMQFFFPRAAPVSTINFTMSD